MKRTVVILAAVCAAVTISVGLASAQTSDIEQLNEATQVGLEKRESEYGQLVDRQRK